MTIIKTDPAEYSLAADYVVLLLDLLKKHQLDVPAITADLPLNDEDLRHPGARISVPVLNELGHRAMAAGAPPWIGMELAADLTLTTHGFLGYAAMSSETLRDALELAVKFFRTRSTILDLIFFTEGDMAVLQFDEQVPLNDLLPFYAESFFGSFHMMGQKLLPDHDVEGELRLTYAKPDYYDRLTQFIPVPVYFECAHNQMRFPASRLDLKLRFADPRLSQMAAAQCEQEMATMKTPPRLLGQVRRIILGEPGRFPNIDEVADELHMSSRTLKRKLKQLGTSYQRILDDLRKGLAVELLMQTSKTVDEIAMALGYSDASNFARAFRRWTGKTPSDYRQPSDED